VLECRCVPETNLLLFPACPKFIDVLQTGDAERWVTSAGDTLDSSSDWVTAKGGDLAGGSYSSSNPFVSSMPDCPAGRRLVLNEPTRAVLVVFNLRTIFLADPATRQADQYMDQLSSDFTFVPDIEDIQLHPDVYDTSRDTLWNWNQERRFAQAILNPEQVGLIAFSRWYESSKDESFTSEDQLQETFYFPYEGQLPRHGAEGEEGTIVEFKGSMEIDMVTPTLENPVWSVRQWRDFRDQASAKRSWGELRAEFAR
jgi:hypothetical protein